MSDLRDTSSSFQRGVRPENLPVPLSSQASSFVILHRNYTSTRLQELVEESKLILNGKPIVGLTGNVLNDGIFTVAIMESMKTKVSSRPE